MPHQIDPKMKACIDDCHHCHVTCLSMAMTHCLEMGGRHVDPVHMRLMLDCAQICATAIDFMARSSAHHAHICRECAEICRACAQSCRDVGDMQECVEACERCADSCERMAEAS